METQRGLGLTHGERALGRHLRPIVIGEARYRAIARSAELILSALGTVAARAATDAALAEALGLTAAERALAEIDPGYPQALAVGRLDMLLDGDDFRVLELNADSPAGITDQAMIHRALAILPHMRALAQGGSLTRGVTAHVPAPQDKLVDRAGRRLRGVERRPPPGHDRNRRLAGRRHHRRAAGRGRVAE